MLQARLRGRLLKRVFPSFIVCGSFTLVVSLVIFATFLHSAYAQQVTLAWNANTETDLQGYKVYQGIASRTYSTNSNVGNATTCTISGLEPGKIYYFSVTAVDSAGNESGYSNEISYMIPKPAPTLEPTLAPTPAASPEDLIIADTPYSSWRLGDKKSNMLYAQSFKAPASSISGVAVALTRFRSPNMPVRVSIRTSSDGSALASAEIKPSRITSKDYRNPSWVTAEFSEPLTVTKGSTYYVVIDVASYNRTNFYSVVVGRDAYADGIAYQSAVTRRSDVDLVCRLTFGQ